MEPGCGNFGALPKPPKRLSKLAASLFACRLQRRGREGDAGVGGLRVQVAEHRHQAVVLRTQFLALRVVVLRHALEDGCKGRHAVSRLVREIRAAEEGLLVVVRQEHGQRPAAAALREHLVRKLVDLVEIGPLLAVDLDVDEKAVHERRRAGVLEGLMRHHVAPVAGRITDRQQDGFAAVAGKVQGFLPPRVPIDGIGCVLLQVRAGFPRQAILVHGPLE
jgi:hypothetical protein